MKELARIDDPVFLTYLLAQLSDAGIEAEVLDQYTMAALGVGVGMIRARVMVDDARLPVAKRILEEARNV
ncbi:MAG: DUF2007 domain-containing protein [Rhodospirillaceae bacterium]